MDLSKLSSALRDLPNRVLNAAVEERLSLFQNVCDILDNPGKYPTCATGLLHNYICMYS
ncbi:PREDICTED: uncharacterized protein LOC108620557, partial [Drosophila arizonae]|uniref:Uncharacterized protein LOC108620557 n=1 Tax=Drosophila arizonae TaxID=7263 RepID=A0ABM1Q0G7_DROAR